MMLEENERLCKLWCSPIQHAFTEEDIALQNEKDTIDQTALKESDNYLSQLVSTFCLLVLQK